VSAYWFDDTGAGECRVPASWRLLYKDGESWKSVEAPSGFQASKNRMNEVSFREVTTQAVRLEITAQPGFSVGVYEWGVE
jgi:hypothetical protein